MKITTLSFIFLILCNSNILAKSHKQAQDSLLMAMTTAIKQEHYTGVHSVLITKDDQTIYEFKI